jgi:type II secretory pathway pseudopilin PulG
VPQGVLVAISIPIFTSQLAKARLATNQANARAAYAAVEAQYLGDDTKTGDFTYNVSDGKIAATAKTDGTAITGTDSTNISNWKTDTSVGSSTLGKTVYKTWTLTVGTDGSVTTHKAGN